MADYVARGGKVRQEDLIFWLTYGLTHNPRGEGFLVMPVEIIKIELKPADFFSRSPAMDVPPSVQDFNTSILVGKSNMHEAGTCCEPASTKKLEASIFDD